MSPLRFGPGNRQMFAIHHPPVAASRHEGVLFCNPFGQEAIRCHRMFRVLADQLARQGFHVLRFDYFATGDSAGEDEEGDLEGWCEDVLAADSELRLRGCSVVSWLGLRLGASIAALASKSCKQPLRRILLWDPVIDGPAHLDDMAEKHIEALRGSFGGRWTIDPRLRDMAARQAQEEILGFTLSPLLREQLGKLSARQLATSEAEHIAVLAEPDLPGLAALRQQLAYFGKPVSVSALETRIKWASNEAMDSSIAPPAALQAVISIMKGNE